MVHPDTLAQFSASLRGQLVQPGDATYDDARRVYNAMIDRYPKLTPWTTSATSWHCTMNFG